jgi:hypothetical protein
MKVLIPIIKVGYDVEYTQLRSRPIISHTPWLPSSETQVKPDPDNLMFDYSLRPFTLYLRTRGIFNGAPLQIHYANNRKEIITRNRRLEIWR